MCRYINEGCCIGKSMKNARLLKDASCRTLYTMSLRPINERDLELGSELSWSLFRNNARCFAKKYITSFYYNYYGVRVTIEVSIIGDHKINTNIMSSKPTEIQCDFDSEIVEGHAIPIVIEQTIINISTQQQQPQYQQPQQQQQQQQQQPQYQPQQTVNIIQVEDDSPFAPLIEQ